MENSDALCLGDGVCASGPTILQLTETKIYPGWSRRFCMIATLNIEDIQKRNCLHFYIKE